VNANFIIIIINNNIIITIKVKTYEKKMI